MVAERGFHPCFRTQFKGVLMFAFLRNLRWITFGCGDRLSCFVPGVSVV
jgi:hypothetical protein